MFWFFDYVRHMSNEHLVQSVIYGLISDVLYFGKLCGVRFSIFMIICSVLFLSAATRASKVEGGNVPHKFKNQETPEGA